MATVPTLHPSNLADLLAARARTLGDRLFVTCADVPFTFAQLDQIAGAVASGLFALGLGRGSRVASMMPTRHESVEIIFGLARLGAVQAPVNVFLKGEFLRHQLTNTAPHAIVVDEIAYRSIEPFIAELRDLRAVIHLDTVPTTRSPGPVHVRWSDLLDSPSSAPDPGVGLDDPAGMLYTSGTSGLSKCCVLSNGYFLRNAHAITRLQTLSDEDVLYTAMPLFHGGAQFNSLFPALLAGIPVHIDATFSARGVLDRLRATHATVLNFVGAMSTALLATEPMPNDREHDVRLMMTAPLSPAKQLALRDRFGIDAWTEIFGQTECVPLTGSPALGERDRASIGAPLDDLEVELLDDNGDPVPIGAVGEICIRPRERHAMFDGYWTAANGLAPAITAEQPWHHTGDAARRQQNGRLVFVDRKKDSLRRRGENVSSGELESAISSHPKVMDVAVHAVPASLTEDDIKACIVLADGVTVEPGELFEFFCATLPYFTIPRYVEIVDELPRNQVGRLLKYKLRETPLTASTWDFEALGLTIAPPQRRGKN